jgi:hypothetical protein
MLSIPPTRYNTNVALVDQEVKDCLSINNSKEQSIGLIYYVVNIMYL